MPGLAPLNAVFRWFHWRAQSPLPEDYSAVLQIKRLAENCQHLDEPALRHRFERLRECVRGGAKSTSSNVLFPGYALFAEAARRVRGVSLFDVQLLAGLALSRRAIAEMQTGEGKTWVAALPTLVHALSGRGVHVLTVNSYLAQRDYELLLPVFRLLGLSVGLLRPQATLAEKRAAYACEITYGPGYQFCFDYLRDQAALRGRSQRPLGESYRGASRGQATEQAVSVQRGLAFAVIDEADSVLIDEATGPLLLSDAVVAPAANAQVFLLAKSIAEHLQADGDYIIDRLTGMVQLTQHGILQIDAAAESAARHGLHRPWPAYVEQALRAQWLLKPDVDYIIADAQIMVVDQHTGRIFADRTWRDGLQQAVQAKEGVPILAENLPLARISRQRFFRLYDGLCGLTGTAQGSEQELWDIYGLPVVMIPLRRPCLRKVLATRCFADVDSKHRAIVAEIQRVHATGQPVLVGTSTIEGSEALAQRLSSLDILYRLLNGKQDADEATIVAHAGEVGAVTIATNMAGRGTDIRLEHGAAELGGLHVIGSERHESSRVDRQLVGRAARQGDPGSCQFFASAEDRLIFRHSPALARRIRQSAQAGGEAFADFSQGIVRAQRRAEHLQQLERQQLFVRDDWLEDVLAKLVSQY